MSYGGARLDPERGYGFKFELDKYNKVRAKKRRRQLDRVDPREALQDLADEADVAIEITDDLDEWDDDEDPDDGGWDPEDGPAFYDPMAVREPPVEVPPLMM